MIVHIINMMMNMQSCGSKTKNWRYSLQGTASFIAQNAAKATVLSARQSIYCTTIEATTYSAITASSHVTSDVLTATW